MESVDQEERNRKFQEIKDSNFNLYLLFHQFKDFFDLRLGNIKKSFDQFEPIEFFSSIENRIKRQLYDKNDVDIRFNIQKDNLPVIVVGDKIRINYVIQKLINIGINRSNSGIHQRSVRVKLKVLTHEDFVNKYEDDIVRLSEIFD